MNRKTTNNAETISSNIPLNNNNNNIKPMNNQRISLKNNINYETYEKEKIEKQLQNKEEKMHNAYKINEEEVKNSILFKELSMKNDSLKEELRKLKEVRVFSLN